PYAAYARLGFKPITQDGGDVYARLMLLLLEAYESIKLVEAALADLPEGKWRGELPETLPKGRASAAAVASATADSDQRRTTIDHQRRGRSSFA
ncbi:hypothetical protein SE17_17755, partial [Kouleothrix aurantiaca]